MQNSQKDINRRQTDFYNFKKKNLATRIWSYFRNGILNKAKKDIGIEKQIIELHTSWLGKLKNKRVLDLGCYAGNSLSMYLAQNAKEYIAIDLSDMGIEKLSKKIQRFDSARAITGDFLSVEFAESDFDIIYAYGVLHHFKDVDDLILVLKEKLKPNGHIISYDPLETSLPLKIIRTLYRPFQSDKDWEWPFSKKVYHSFSSSFHIKDRRAILGKTKWFFLLELMPWSKERKLTMLKKWHRYDWEGSQESDTQMFKCMHLTMLMENKI